MSKNEPTKATIQVKQLMNQAASTGGAGHFADRTPDKRLMAASIKANSPKTSPTKDTAGEIEELINEGQHLIL